MTSGESLSEDVVFFLSHRSEDKKRLEAIVLQLLNADIPLWIDKPGRVTKDLRIVNAGRIRYGEEWADDIEKAVAQANSFILFAWSRAAAKKMAGPAARGSLKWELERGLDRRRLIGFRIDRTPFDPLPAAARDMQWADLSDYRPDQPHAEFNLFLQDLKSRLASGRAAALRFHSDRLAAASRRHGAGSRQSNQDRALLPYEADRTDPFLKLVSTAQERARGPSPSIIVAGPGDEAPDQFIDRWRRQLSALEKKPVAQTVLTWPDEVSDDSMRARLGHELLNNAGAPMSDIEARLRQEGGAGQRRAIVAYVCAENWTSAEPAKLSAWCGFWRTLVERCPEGRFVPVLCVWLSDANKDWKDAPPTPPGQTVSNRVILKSLSGFKTQAVVVGTLSPFGRGQAMDWRTETMQLLGGQSSLARAAAQSFDDVFKDKRGRVRRVSMQTFANALGPVLARQEDV